MKQITLFLTLITLFSCGHPERYGCNINDDGTYECVDGSKGTLPRGSQGEPGENGTNGQDAEACTVVDTEDGAKIVCPDGSEVEVLDGIDGEDGSTVIIICHKNKHKKPVCIKREDHA